MAQPVQKRLFVIQRSAIDDDLPCLTARRRRVDEGKISHSAPKHSEEGRVFHRVVPNERGAHSPNFMSGLARSHVDVGMVLVCSRAPFFDRIKCIGRNVSQKHASQREIIERHVFYGGEINHYIPIHSFRLSASLGLNNRSSADFKSPSSTISRAFGFARTQRQSSRLSAARPLARVIS